MAPTDLSVFSFTIESFSFKVVDNLLPLIKQNTKNSGDRCYNQQLIFYSIVQTKRTRPHHNYIHVLERQ